MECLSDENSMDEKRRTDSTKQVPIPDLKMETGVEDFLDSPAMEPYVNLMMAMMQGEDTGPAIQELPAVPLDNFIRVFCRQLVKWLPIADNLLDKIMEIMYIFDHIYKTAGTTFNLAYLPGAFEPEKIFVLRGMRDANLADLKKLRALSQEELRPLQVIAGHNAGQLRGAFHRKAKFLTLVRNPTARAISGYLHALLHDDAFEIIGRELREQNIGLSGFIEQDLFARRYADFVSLHDWQAKVLLGVQNLSDVPRTEEGITEAIRSRYYLVGYTEAFEMFLFMLHVTEKFPLALFGNRLVRPECQSWRVTDADLATIERYSRLDQQVYDCVRKEFDRRVSAIWTYSVARQYDRYLTALKEFREEEDRNKFLGSVRFLPVRGNN